MFRTSTYCIPNTKESKEFEPTYSTPTERELDDPMFDKHIEQDIDISITLTQPHQTYSEVVQRQCSNTRNSETPYIADKVKSTDTDQGMVELSRTDDQQHQLADKESTSVINCWSEPVSLPETQTCNRAELPYKT